MTIAAVQDLITQTLQTMVQAGPTGFLAISVMATIFVVAVIGLIRGRANLRSQRRALNEAQYSTQRAAVGSVNLGTNTKDDSDSIFLSSYQQVSEEANSLSHPEQILNLIRSHSKLASPSVEVVLDAVRSYAPPGLERQRATQNVLLLVGLAGTVFGLAAAIGEVQLGALGGTGTESASLAISAFERVLEKLPTAFVSTIWGILLALLYGPFASGLEAATNNYVSDLTNEAVGAWIPKYWPAGTEAQLEDLRKVMETTQQTIQNAGQEMQNATTTLNQSLENASTEMGKHVSELASVTDESQTMFSRLSTEVTASVTALRDGTEGMRSSIKQLRDLHGEVTGAYSKMHELFEEAQEAAKQQIEDTLQVTKHQQQQVATLSSDLFVRLDQMIGRFDASTRELQGQNETFSRGFNEVGLQVNRAVEKVLDTSVLRFNDAAGHLLQATEPLSTTLDSLNALVSGSLASSEGSEQLAALRGAVTELLQASSGLAKALNAADGVGPQLANLSGNLTALPDRLSAVTARFEELVTQGVIVTQNSATTSTAPGPFPATPSVSSPLDSQSPPTLDATPKVDQSRAVPPPAAFKEPIAGPQAEQEAPSGAPAAQQQQPERSPWRFGPPFGQRNRQ